MSVVSAGRKSSTPSILKRTGRPKVSTPGRLVQFKLDYDLKALLVNYRNDLKKDPYVELVCNIRDSARDIRDDELLRLIADACNCLPLLDENVKLFVQVLMIIKWAHRNDDVVAKYQDFLLDICSAYNYYTKFAIQQLVSTFLEVNENSIPGNCRPSEDEERIFQNVHNVLGPLLKIVPMASNILLETLKRKFPFKQAKARCHLNYIHNLLFIPNYLPKLRRDILSLIINKLVHLDVVLSKELIEKLENNNTPEGEDGVFAMEIDNEIDIECEDDMRSEDAKTLDHVLHRFYEYLHEQCHDKNGQLVFQKTKTLYQDLISIFEDVLLPTHASHHIQFVYFYLISFKWSLTEHFVNFLWKKVTNLSVAPVIRQAALCYISAVVTRAKYVSLSFAKSVITDLTTWIHQYIENGSAVKMNSKMPLTRIHSVFYSACHALFYIIAFRHQELLSTKKNIKFVNNLNLGQIVTCRYRPLSVCSSAVAANFAQVMQTYQLAYCYTVMDSSTQSTSLSMFGTTDAWIDDFFPFDFYLLKRSKNVIAPLYQEYEAGDLVSPGKDISKKEEEDNDDFIPSGTSPNSAAVHSVAFGCTSSPGFFK